MIMEYIDYSVHAPSWADAFLMWTCAVVALSTVALLLSARTRIDALAVIAASVAILIGMQWIFANDAQSRLLVAPQVVVWTILVAYLRIRLSRGSIGVLQRAVIWTLVVTLVVNLGFNYADLIKYAQGDTRFSPPAPVEALSSAPPVPERLAARSTRDY